MKALIDAPRPLPGLSLARRLERFLPADRDGLLFALPSRAHAEAVWNGGKPRLLLPSVQSVDAAGTYFDPRTDLITPAIANRLRIGGIDKATKKQGALFEGARTNSCLQSEAFDNASWVKSRSTVAADDTTAPDGNLTADKLVENTESNTHHIAQTIAFTSGERVAYSIFAKKGERSEFRFQSNGVAAPSGNIVTVWFNLDTGTKGTVSAGIDDSGMDDMGDGWYRCWMVWTADASDNSQITVAMSAGSENISYTGDGSSGLYLWGPQCEQNVRFPCSYIKTTTAAVTRAKDVLNYDNTSEVNCKASAGTVYIAVTPEWDVDNADNLFFDCRTENEQNGFQISRRSNNKFRAMLISDNVAQASLLSSVSPVRGTTYIVVFTWKLNDFKLYVDGTEDANDTSGSVPTSLGTEINLGTSEDQSLNAHTHLAHVHIYDSVHDAARVLQNTKEIQAWLGI